MTLNWLDDAELDALIEQAQHSRSKSVRFDPEVPGGFRLLTDQEDRDLTDAIRLPRQRADEDRDHLAHEQDTAERDGDGDGTEQAAEHQRVLDDEQARDQRSDPRLPTRDELAAIAQRGDRNGWTEQSARAFEYLDQRRDITDERAAAAARGDTAEVAYLDSQHDLVERTYRAYVGEPERDDEEHPARQAQDFERQLFSETHGGARGQHERIGWDAREIDDEELER